MTTINFDAVSVGTVSSGADALSVTNTGSGNGVAASSESGIGVTGSGFITGVFGGSPTREGVRGQSRDGTGVRGDSENSDGIHGESLNDVGVTGQGGRVGISGTGSSAGVVGSSTKTGIHGKSTSKTDSGVLGENNGNGNGVTGFSQAGIGVRGDTSEGFAAVHGHGAQNGVWGFSLNPTASGVFGQNDGKGNGMAGFSQQGIGVRGDTPEGFAAVHGHGGQHGVWGFSVSDSASGVLGQNDASGMGVLGLSKDGIGVFGKGGRLAARFEGIVEVTVDIRLGNADCAEDFDIAGTEEIEPGSVMVLNPEGALQQSRLPYDKRVAGVISGAGDLRPGIVLDKRETEGHRLPVALLGKVYCKVDAQYSPVDVGDLLTTSATPGHAMKASDGPRAFGSVIGKALRPLQEGRGLIPILIALQ